LIRWIAKNIYHFLGWKVEGRYPHTLKKKIVIVAPHTSNMDFYIGFLAKTWLNVTGTFYAKGELFKGIVGWILALLGGRPVDRSKRENLVTKAVKDFNDNETHTVLLAPEGTRKKVNKFKSGFYFMALKANVPIVPVAIDYLHKVIKILPNYYIQGKGESEIEEIRQMFKEFQGRIPAQGIT